MGVGGFDSPESVPPPQSKLRGDAPGYRRPCHGDCNAGRLAKICSGPTPVSIETTIFVTMVLLVAGHVKSEHDCLSPRKKSFLASPTLSDLVRLLSEIW